MATMETEENYFACAQALTTFLLLPPNEKAVKLIKFIISNLVKDPENQKFQTINEVKVASKFKEAWSSARQLLISIGFGKDSNSEGKLILNKFIENEANHIVQKLTEYTEQKKTVSNNVEITENEILNRMHTWSLSEEIEEKLSYMLIEITDKWKSHRDAILKFFDQDMGEADQRVMQMSLNVIMESHVQKQLKNWESIEFLKQGVPELNSEYLTTPQNEGKLGLQILFEEVIAITFSARCFEKMMFVHSSFGEANIDIITSSAAARKVALIQLSLGLIQFFETYQDNLYKKLNEENAEN